MKASLLLFGYKENFTLGSTRSFLWGNFCLSSHVVQLFLACWQTTAGAGKLQQSFLRLHWDIAHAFVCTLPRAACMQQWQRWAAETETTRPTMSHGNAYLQGIWDTGSTCGSKEKWFCSSANNFCHENKAMLLVCVGGGS